MLIRHPINLSSRRAQARGKKNYKIAFKPRGLREIAREGTKENRRVLAICKSVEMSHGHESRKHDQKGSQKGEKPRECGSFIPS